MTEKKTIELWEGYAKSINLSLLDDVDFVIELSQAQKEQDLPKIISMYFALIGGDETYEEVKEHIKNEKGYFSVESLQNIIDRINSALPKGGHRAYKYI